MVPRNLIYYRYDILHVFDMFGGGVGHFHLKVAALWLTSWLETAHSCVTKCFTASVLRLAEPLNTRSIMAGSTAIDTA